ncbi:MAG: aminoglycoside phosphotransferase family protein [Acidimicrobiia bacterium]
MLAADDAVLARRDPAVPGLATVLDPAAVAERLRRLLPGAETAQPTYVRYKPGSSCLVAYRVESDRGVLPCYAKAYSRPEKLQKLHQPGPTLGFADELIGVAVFPYDRALPSLGRLVDAPGRQRLLSGLLGDGWWQGSVRLIRYKPERRLVARFEGEEHPPLLLKFYDQPGYATADRAARSFRSQGVLRAPRRLGGSGRHRVLALEWVIGQPLSEGLGGTPDRSLMDVGAALAAFHRQRPDGLPARHRTEEVAAISSGARAVAALDPSQAEGARQLAAGVSGPLLGAPELPVATHGDFAPDQILLNGARVAIVDYDRAMIGDPAADLGSFAARLEVEVLEGRLGRARAAEVLAAVLSGYREAGGTDPSPRLAAYTAAGLLRLAAEPFRYRMRHWPERMRSMLARAAEVRAR